MALGIGDIARGTRRRSPDHTVETDRRLTKHLRRLDEHRNRIEYVEGVVDDTATDLGQLAGRLAALERRLVELQVAAGCDCGHRHPSGAGDSRRR